MGSISDEFMTLRVIIDVLFIINVVYRWHWYWELLNYALMGWSCHISFWGFELITLILIFVGTWSFKLYGRHSDLTCWYFFRVDSSWGYLIFWKILLITCLSIKRYLCLLVGVLWYRFTLNFGWLNKLRFIRGYTLKFDLRRPIILPRWFLEFLLPIIKLLWICSWFDGIWLVLVFVWTTTHERNLVYKFTLILLVFLHQYFPILMESQWSYFVGAWYKYLGN